MVNIQYTDESNNVMECMIEVTVQDKLDPILTCPSAQKPGLPPGLSGPCNNRKTATAVDNCADITPTYEDSGSLNSCGVGVITRTWTADDGNGQSVSCAQTITITNDTPFYRK